MTTLIRWDPVRELAQWQNDVERLMGTFLRGARVNGEDRWAPPLDVWETEDELVYAFDLPGIPEDKISIELEDGTLTVSAERERTDEVSKDRFYRFERRYGSFARSIGLPQGVTESDDPRRLQGRRARAARDEAEGSGAAPNSDRQGRKGDHRGQGLEVVAPLGSGTGTAGACPCAGPAASYSEGASTSSPASASSSRSRLRPVNIRLLIVPERLAEPLRQLRLREAAVVGELDRLALVGGQLAERLLDDLPLRAQPRLLVGRLAGRLGEHRRAARCDDAPHGGRCRRPAGGRA